MRLTFNRLLALAAIAATSLMAGCSTDSPGPTQNPGPGGNGGLSIQLSTTNSTPKAGTCTLIQAFATQNGSAVPDGTSVQFTTVGGAFAQNGAVAISVVTNSGVALTALCADSEGTAIVKAKVTIGKNSAQATLPIQFTSSGFPTGPFISICANPHSGPVTGNTPITITGGGFGNSLAAVKVYFKSGGVTHQAVVTAVSDSTIQVISPAFPELNGLGATSAEIDVVIPGTVLVSPNCFTYTASASFISICATPGSGPITGNTSVQIQGGGFGNDPAQVSVSFRIGSTTLPAVVTGVTDTSISVITPAFPGLNATQASTADIIVKIGAQTTLTSIGCFTYTQTGLTPTVSSILPSSGTKLGGTRVTILGSGFSAPVQVFFGTVQAEIVSVNFSQIVAITPPLPLGSSPGLTGVIVPVVVKNAACGTGTNCQSNGGATYTYTVPLTIVSFSPLTGGSDTVVTIFGQGFVAPVQVLFGGKEGRVVSVTGTQILVRPPAGCTDIGGQITVILIATGESAISSASFTGPPPMTGSILPIKGPIGVATPVVLTGTGLFPAGNTAALQIVGVPTGGTVSILSAADINGTQTVNLSITPNPVGCVASEFVNFTLENTVTGCTLDFSFTGTGTGISVSAPVPASGPLTNDVTVSGTGLFPTGDATKLVIDSQSGGTVSISGTTDGETQKVTLHIVATLVANCAPSPVTFTLKNTSTGCISQPLTYTGSSGIVVLSGPSPSSGPAGVATSGVIVTGTGFFPTGSPAQVEITDVNPASPAGIVVLNSTGQSGSTQTLSLTITPPPGCAASIVTFQIHNKTTNCKSDPLSFNVSSGAGITVSSGPTPGTVAAGTSTPGVTVTGTGFSTNTAAGLPDATIVNVTPGFTVTKTAGVDSAGSQTLTLTVVTPASCSSGSFTFQIQNTATGCVSAPITVNTSGGITIVSGPTPPSGSASVDTPVTIVGTGFDPTLGNNTIVNLSPVTATVTITADVAGPGSNRTLTLHITPLACTSGTVTFQIKNTVTGCVSPVITYTVTTGILTVTTGPTPLFGQAGFPNAGVVITGSNFFPPGDPADVDLQNVVFTPNNGSIAITQATSNGDGSVQTVTLTITPPTDNTTCGQTSVSFQVHNKVSGCLSNVLSFAGIQQPTVVTGPNPGSGPGGVGTDVTLTGFNFFRSGHPADATITATPSGGTVTIKSASENLATPNQPQTLVVTITPDCLSQFVTFTVTNTGSTCVSNQVFFNNSTFVATTVTASFSQTPGATSSGQITFNSTSTGTGLTCSWTFAGGFIFPPVPTTSASCGPVLVQWDCSAGVPIPCTTPATATLTVTDACGNSDSEGPDGVTPP